MTRIISFILFSESVQDSTGNPAREGRSLPYQYALEERGCLYLEIDNEGRFLLCFNRHKPEVGAKMLKETDTIRPVHNGSGLTEGIFLHRVQKNRECLDKTLGQLISVNICICFPMEEIEGKENSLWMMSRLG